MVADPAEYRWSSYRCNALGRTDKLITPHPQYLALGADAGLRQSAYRALFKQALGDDELARIREHVQQQKALGSSRFQAEIEALLARKVAVRPRGRPRLEDD